MGALLVVPFELDELLLEQAASEAESTAAVIPTAKNRAR
jgi:hypothetical protein